MGQWSDKKNKNKMRSQPKFTAKGGIIVTETTLPKMFPLENFCRENKLFMEN